MLKDSQTKTITPDRGKEFSRHEEISKALNDVQFYFPEPHQPWQKADYNFSCYSCIFGRMLADDCSSE